MLLCAVKQFGRIRVVDLIRLVHSTDLFQFGKGEIFFFPFCNSCCRNVDMLSLIGCSTIDGPKLYTHFQWCELSAFPFRCRGLGEILFPVESAEAVKRLTAE